MSWPVGADEATAVPVAPSPTPVEPGLAQQMDKVSTIVTGTMLVATSVGAYYGYSIGKKNKHPVVGAAVGVSAMLVPGAVIGLLLAAPFIHDW